MGKNNNSCITEQRKDTVEYLTNLISYLKSPSTEGYQRLNDSVGTYLVTTKTNQNQYFSKNLETFVKDLETGNKKTWADLLFSIDERLRFYRELKSLSPFKDKCLLHVSYGSCNEPVIIDLEGLTRAIGIHLQSNDYMTHDYDSYILELPLNIFDILKQSDITWLSSPVCDVDFPRKTNGSKRE